MNRPVDSGRGRLALLVCHCAGMVDLLAMPVWMEALITDYALGAQKAGALVSLFLVAAVASSIALATRFGRVNGPAVAVPAYAVAAFVFGASALTRDFASLCGLYVAGGVAVGCGLSVTHGAIGRSANPHRLFALAGAAAGCFAIAFFGAVAVLTSRFGGAALFWLIAGVMATACLLSVVAFPSVAASVVASARQCATASKRPLSAAVWLAIGGVSCMALSQAIAASFLQNIGLARGFGAERVHAVLIGLAVLTLLPGPLAMLLQGRLPARAVVLAGPLLQTAVTLTLSHSLLFWPYAAAGALLTSVQVFVHTFAFGLIARIDTSGRAVSATPAMLMAGSALGPFLAGTLVALSGYESLGYAVTVISLVALWCFHRATRAASAAAEPGGLRRAAQ